MNKKMAVFSLSSTISAMTFCTFKISSWDILAMYKIGFGDSLLDFSHYKVSLKQAKTSSL